MFVDIGPYTDNDEDRHIFVQVDDHDIWGLDHTLALIIVPALKKLKENKQGAPKVDNEDVPENLRSDPQNDTEEAVDDLWFKRWEYVIDEMIWAFEQVLLDGRGEDQFCSGESDYKFVPTETGSYKVEHGPNHTLKLDSEGLKTYWARIERGTTLFGKYYRGLWD